MEPLRITSNDNPQFKRQQKALQDRDFRRSEALLWVEGPKVISQLEPSRIEALFATEGFDLPSFLSTCQPGSANIPTILLVEPLARRAFDTLNPQHVGALVRWNPVALDTLDAAKGLLILDGIQDPGNTGTLLRTAAGLGYGGAVIAGGAEPRGPKVVRAAAGAHFVLPIAEAKLDEIRAHLQAANIPAFLAEAHGTAGLPSSSKGPFALVVGSEAHGISPGWQGKPVTIPVTPGVESLNAAMAGGILMWRLKNG
ncbi:MAG: TrmH family RNA methyltransferase [Planctomycetota bacterium]